MRHIRGVAFCGARSRPEGALAALLGGALRLHHLAAESVADFSGRTLVFGDPVAFIIGSIFLIPAILLAVPIHELGHALAAVLMGDPTARNRGYFSPSTGLARRLFNVYGIVAAFLINVTWGSPAQVNEYRLNGIWRKLAHVLGGPAANLVAAAVFGVVLRLLLGAGAFPNPRTLAQPPQNYLATVVYALYFLNLATFAFQLLPVPGLDGWRIVETLFRARNPRFFFNVAANVQTIWLIAAAVVFLGPLVLRFPVLDYAVAIFYQPAASVILGSCTGYVVLIPCLA
jgi:Zn-dependent protease